MRTDRLRRAYDVEIVVVHFPLHPETPPEGRALTDLFRGREAQLDEMRRRLIAAMEAEGLPYGDRRMTYNSRLAQELAAWAVTQPGGEAIHDALFRAYFVEARNIGDTDVLVDVAAGVGLAEDAVRRTLRERTHQAAVDRDWDRSRTLGVTGVPTYVIGDRGVVGAQPYEMLERLALHAGAVRR